MKKKLLLTLIVLLIAGCSKPESAKRVLKNSGYEDITITGWSPFSCDEKDTYSTGFTATSPSGSKVEGTVCEGVFKGATIRFN